MGGQLAYCWNTVKKSPSWAPGHYLNLAGGFFSPAYILPPNTDPVPYPSIWISPSKTFLLLYLLVLDHNNAFLEGRRGESTCLETRDSFKPQKGTLFISLSPPLCFAQLNAASFRMRKRQCVGCHSKKKSPKIPLKGALSVVFLAIRFRQAFLKILLQK